jgi:hypothetical protein
MSDEFLFTDRGLEKLDKEIQDLKKKSVIFNLKLLMQLKWVEISGMTILPTNL